MTNYTKLPRLDTNTSNKNLSLGGLQIFLGIISILTAITVLLLHGILSLFSSADGSLTTFFTILLWGFIALGLWFILAGMSRVSVNSTYRRLQNVLNGGDFTIEKLSEMLGMQPERLLQEISLMNKRKYWRQVTVLEDTLVIEPLAPSTRVHKITANDNMRFTTKLAGDMIPYPVVIAVLIGIVKIVPLPFYSWIWVIVAIVASVPVKKLSKSLTTKYINILYDKIPQYTADKIELELSGNEQADTLIAEAKKQLAQLSNLERSIKDPHLNKRIKEISVGTNQMMSRLKDSPDKYKQVHQTMNYSLPTAIDLFHKYEKLDAQPVKGDNIKRSMAKIHEMSDLVAVTFKRELDAMYQDQTLDIEVDIEVMRNLMQQEAMEVPTLLETISNDVEKLYPEESSNKENNLEL